MDKFFKTSVDEETKSYVFTRVDNTRGELDVVVSSNRNEDGEDPTSVVINGDAAQLSGEEFDDLNVRVRMARQWIERARGNVTVMKGLLGSI